MVPTRSRYVIAEIKRKRLTSVLLNIGKALNPYLSRPLPTKATLDDFFKAFPDGERTLQPTHFHAQTRMNFSGPPLETAGRIDLSYVFYSQDNPKGKLTISISDNKESISQEQINQVYWCAIKYLSSHKFPILEDGIRSEL